MSLADHDWGDAVLFDSGPRETFRWDDPVEAAVDLAHEQWLVSNGFAPPLPSHDAMVDFVREVQLEVEITGYRRCAHTLEEIQSAAAEGAAVIDELLGEYDDPDGRAGEFMEALERALTATVTRLLRDVEVWACEPVCTHTLKPEEVVEALVACGTCTRDAGGTA